MPAISTNIHEYSNEDAAALSVFVLNKLTFNAFEINFPCGCDEDVLKKFSEIFCVDLNEVEVIHRAFIEYSGATTGATLPTLLEEIVNAWSGMEEKFLYDSVDKLINYAWLPDLEQIWEKCEVGLVAEKDLAEVEIPSEIAKRIGQFLSSERGYTINDVASTAMHITSKTNKQKSIISFAVLSKLKHILPFLNAIGLYNDKAQLVKDALVAALPVTLPDKDKNQQSVTDHIRSDNFDNVQLNKILVDNFGSAFTSNRFIKALKDDEWSGIKKSIFRSKKDVLNSVCLNKLNFENVKMGYIENLIEYFIENDDDLPEMKSSSPMNSNLVTSVQPDLDRNIIFFGAPGTGKSFAAKSYAGSNYIERVVFSADYQNSDFVGYLQPQADPKHGAKYEFESGPFIRALKIAFQKKDQPVVLLIEEINRGNAPAIFGELFQLLDRGASGESEYRVSVAPSVLKELSDISEFVSAQQIWLPSNLFIVGTMNSSDQGVFPLDTAFKRRFSFEYVPVDFDAHQTKPDFIDQKINVGGLVVSWQIFGKAINETLLDAQTAEDKLLGPFFLSPSELSKPNLDTLIVQKVCFYLWEDVLRHEDKNLIFAENLRSFSDLQNKFKARENIFSDKVLDYILELSPSNAEALDEGQIDSAD